MRRMGVAAMVVLCAVGLSAEARQRKPPDELPPSVPPPVSTLPPSRGISGPKLQPGAVLCGTEDYLQHRVEVDRRRAEGLPDAGNPLAGCRIMGQEAAVEVLERHGLSRVEVRLKTGGEVGWTDAYVR